MLALLAAAAVLLHNADVLTMDPARPRARAVAIVDDRIVGVGEARDLEPLLPTGARRIDLGGRALLPGFNDAHVHLGLGLSIADAVELRGTTKAAFLAEVQRAVARLKPGEWLFAISPNALPDGLETGAPLDAITRTPVFIVTPFGGLMNGAAVFAAELRDEVPWGFVRGRHVAAALDAIARRRPIGELRQVAREFLAEAARLGVTSVQAMSDQFADLFEGLRRAGALSCRVRFVPLGQLFRDDYHATFWSGPAPLWVRVDGWKYFHDQEAPLERRVLKQMVRRAVVARRRTVVHVHGQAPLVRLLDTIEAEAGNDRSLASLFRVEHADTVSREEARRLARLGITVCSNPTLADEWKRQRLYPLRTLLDAGVSLCLGSDWLGRKGHRRSLDPLAGVRFVATRPGPERITVGEALSAYTLGAARAEGLEAEKGSITRGKLADLVVLSRDPTRGPAEAMADVRVIATMVGGRWVFGGL